jgi:magnesium transporter
MRRLRLLGRKAKSEHKNSNKNDRAHISSAETMVDGYFSDLSSDDIMRNVSTDDMKKFRFININGLGDIEKIRKVSKIFDIPDMWIEDIMNIDSLSRYETFRDTSFLSFKFPYIKDSDIDFEHISCNLTSDGHIVCFQNTERDMLSGVPARVKKDGDDESPHSILLHIIDYTVDEYFEIIDLMAEKIEHMITYSGKDPDRSYVIRLDDIRRALFILARRITNLSDIFEKLTRCEEFSRYSLMINDINTHILTVEQNTRYFQDVVKDLKDTYNSIVNDRINQRMSILAVVAALFTPLTFIAGIYGMNFTNMPELEWEYSYFVVLGVMVFIFSSLLIYFIRKGWFGGRQ